MSTRTARLRVLSARLCAAPALTPQAADLMVRLDYAANNDPDCSRNGHRMRGPFPTPGVCADCGARDPRK